MKVTCFQELETLQTRLPYITGTITHVYYQNEAHKHANTYQVHYCIRIMLGQ